MKSMRPWIIAGLLLASTSALADEAVPAAQAATLQVSALGGQQPERYIVDPQDNVERLLLLTPAGPLVVEIAMNIDGEPFRVSREKLVDEQIQQADSDGDGTATWTEAIASRRFAFGRFASFANLNDQQREQQMKTLDRNQNGRVDRFEARLLLSQIYGGATFSVQGIQNGGLAAEGIRQLLDVNGDNSISAEEVSAAESRLKSRDGDDNDVLYSAELSGQANPYGNLVVQRNGRVAGQQTMLYLLGPLLNIQVLYKDLLQRYAGADSILTVADFPRTPSLVSSVDINGNGQLDVGEVAGFNAIAPHLRLAANFSETAAGQELSLVTLHAELGPAEDVLANNDGQYRLTLPGLRLQLSLSPPPAAYNFQAQADAYLMRLDANKNGYAEKEEVTSSNQALGQQFDLWDADGDGKVFAAELNTFFEQQYNPRRTQITAVASQEDDPLFAALDENGDGRLGLREMRTAPIRVRAFDTNGNGQIDLDEIPQKISLAFARGQVVYNQRNLRVAAVRNGNAAPASTDGAGPDWFQRMDRNGDGDISPREFLGTAEQFAELDANQDGLIERAEADKTGGS